MGFNSPAIFNIVSSRLNVNTPSYAQSFPLHQGIPQLLALLVARDDRGRNPPTP